MFSKTLFTTLLLASSALSQSTSAATPAQSSAVASATGSSATGSGFYYNQQDTENLVDYLLPSAPTSLAPAQASKIAADASNFLAGYTSSKPIAQLEQGAVVGVLLGNTQPSGPQQSSIGDLLGMAGTAALANPSAYVKSVEDLVQPFAFATAVGSYANGLFDGLRTVVASDLSVAVPTPTTTSSKAAAAGGRRDAIPTGVVGAAAAAALGVAGMYI